MALTCGCQLSSYRGKEKLKFNRERFSPLTNSQWEVIEKMVDTGRKRKHSLRKVVDGLLKLTRSSVQWRNMEEKPTMYPAWESLYYYFQKWQKQGLWGEILTLLVRAEHFTSQSRTQKNRQTRTGFSSCCGFTKCKKEQFDQLRYRH